MEVMQQEFNPQTGLSLIGKPIACKLEKHWRSLPRAHLSTLRKVKGR